MGNNFWKFVAPIPGVTVSWDEITPWNTKSEKAQIEAEKAQVESDIRIREAKAGLLDGASLEALKANSNTTTYVILGVALVLVVFFVFWFKSRRK